MAIAVPLNEVSSPTLKKRLAHAERVNRWKASTSLTVMPLGVTN